MDVMVEIERLCSSDRTAADEAFRRLRPRVERFLERYLRTWLASASEREDVMAITIQRIWERRNSFEIRSTGAWWVYVATIAKRCAFDALRKPVPEALDDEIPERDRASLEELFSRCFDREAIERAADELWLKQSPELNARDRNRRRLAAQLFFLHGRPWQEVVECVGLRPCDRPELDRWLGDAGSCLAMAYGELYWHNERLVRRLLKALSEESEARKQLLVWRFRNGLLVEKILQLSPGTTQAEVDEVVERCRAHFPFDRVASALAKAYRKQPEATAAMAKPDLWKRLVFQYETECDLPHRQILERTESPAAILGYRLNANILTVWIGNHRLVDQLAKHVARGS